MKINFYLKEPNSVKESLILVTVSLNGKRTKFSTTQKINPKYWNINNQRIKSNAPNALNFNKILNTIQSKILDLYTKNFIENDKSMTVKFFDEVRTYLSGKFENSEIDLTVDKGFDKFLEIRKSNLKEGTVKAYTTLRNHLKSYSVTMSKKDLLFDDLDISFFDGFMNYLQMTCKQKTNTRSKQIKNIKSFLKFMYDRNHHTNKIFEKLEREHEKGQFVDFIEKDFKKILNLDLSNHGHLDITRRLFCISCLTGLRHSDVLDINYKNIKNGKYHFKNTKKNRPDIIAMSVKAVSYIKEFNDLYGVGKGYTNQTSNKHLTKILIKAEISEEILINEKDYKGDVIAVVKPLYDWVTFHYGRRYFIIGCLNRGLQPLEIMQITGHEDFGVFQNYVKFADNDNVKKLNKAWSDTI
ncbi:site-specific integrase [Chryseobacterium phocaeense]|uniref:site-specific integrase n=1 Tax=Chryseobacterium phocaeense TaxID=1816690 RepID=UPI0009BB005F|nr:site-specific integrase [Chryseobacterium phocaeense]